MKILVLLRKHMANIVNQRNKVIVNTLKNVFSSIYLTLKTLSSTEEVNEDKQLNVELEEIKKQENRNVINNLEYIFEENKSSKSKKTVVNPIKIQNPKNYRNKRNIQKDSEKEIGE